MINNYYNLTVKVWNNFSHSVIGASLSEPHTSRLNGIFLYIYICFGTYTVIRVNSWISKQKITLFCWTCTVYDYTISIKVYHKTSSNMDDSSSSQQGTSNQRASLLRHQNNVKIDYVKGEKPTTEKKRWLRDSRGKACSIDIQRRSRQQECASETDTQRTARLDYNNWDDLKKPGLLKRQKNKGQLDCSNWDNLKKSGLLMRQKNKG